MAACGITSPKIRTNETDKMIARYSGTSLSKKMGKASIDAAFHYNLREYMKKQHTSNRVTRSQ
jgi:hypothetical protein